MDSVRLTEAFGYNVGDLLLISSEALDARVAGATPRRVLIAWPWWGVDLGSVNSWDGTVGFPRDSDAYDWCNTPWRLEPDPSELDKGGSCFVGIPPTEVRIIGIEKFEPPADFDFLPRPDCALEVCPVDMLEDDEAGYVLYLNGEEPIEIEVIESATESK